ncbi:MAG TPA: lactate utilization protein B [Alphaproteobacteria bacterium]|nr:lactate utilization protein B [Alphaproteobacteria bacterium]
MRSTSHAFKDNAHRALDDQVLQRAMGIMKTGFLDKRLQAIEGLPEFDALRDAAREIKNHTLAHLDWYLERYETKVKEAGGEVHWARTPAEACAIVLEICERLGARTAAKGKTMIAEEIGLNEYLAENGVAPVETDLGEYIIQIRNEPPSHIIAPAIHLTKEAVADSFRATHTAMDPARSLAEPRDLVDEARQVLREKFFAADVGITGANFLIAETGSSVIVTNEGNGDLTQLLPRAHIVLASLEKVVPTLEDAATILRVLARSATGQDMSAYTTFSTGPRRADDLDGPAEYHVVLLDNGRSALLGSEFREILRCIRCGACMNHCPVYAAVGGHAYGWVYPGPMGAVLTPSLIGIENARDLPNASTFCGRCESVCPMRIPLPKLMRRYRELDYERKLAPRAMRWGIGVWAYFAKRPPLYHFIAAVAAQVLGLLGRRHGSFYNLPLASGWTATREFPAPEGRTFQELWFKRNRAPKTRATR